ncbi:MAG TPA: DNA recombination/repair protein RecA, partial [Myxococcus sp.]|nr:DNA recombination/repair protein RecA [Myxococcus sp.]
DIMYGTGISREGDLIDLASNDNIVEKSGSWFSFNGERIGQGRENAKDYLKEHPEVAKEIEARVLEKYGIGKDKAAAAGAAAAPAEEAPAEGHTEKRQRVKAVK